jgi:hypothetical protein
VALPLPLRNRLAELILDAVHDAEAREGLAALAAVCADPHALADRPPPARFPADLFERDAGGLVIRGGFAASAGELGARAQRGWRALHDRPVAAGEPGRDEALDVAATLFDAGLYFEVHELLEPHWFRALGPEREALQGLIQIAVGFQHLVNGNRRGALALLHEGVAKAAAGRIPGLPLDAFAEAVRRCGAALAAVAEGDDRFDWASVPSFPRGGSPRR